ncbi:MAG: adenosylcobinamide-phosphate synthase CbiB [Alphaproteobacteria bacterium]|jgi:adenosylcobinamide-phosphate synthase|nr:cobalamin biosynthesis protein CobD [Rhodospirillaceae bacterium]MDP6407340.1 adenosylcobinamide-phosphate synthase CbiB [Alphaproteobacteria bacterium]MDP6624779.1 adenosylcobinamide-phosphate synthase CbiB [Alphaproteobacteria bacterium]
MLTLWHSGFADGVNLLAIAVIAFGIDFFVGDPPWLYRRLPHPVALLGGLIGWLEAALNRPDRSAAARRQRGLAMTLLVVALAFAVGWFLSDLVRGFRGGWVIEAMLASTLLAYKGLADAVRAVAEGLEQSLDAGRQAVSHIVGRDPQSLDSAGVARAAIETAAENLSDGVVAPLFWYLMLGLPGLAAYKAVNTLDSMIGYRTPRYEAFGAFAARLDDFANYFPARLCGGLLVLAAAIAPSADGGDAAAAMQRDAGKHRSPNAGWPEAAMAGGLGLRLAGPRRYEERTVDDSWMGDGRAQATALDVHRALVVYQRAGALLAVGMAFILLLMV